MTNTDRTGSQIDHLNIGVADLAASAHLAFSTPDRATVDAFHAAALSAGAIEVRPPGLQPEYPATYYGSFVRDLNGIDLEAVCHHE